jgi:hypothetical protein
MFAQARFEGVQAQRGDDRAATIASPRDYHQAPLHFCFSYLFLLSFIRLHKQTESF